MSKNDERKISERIEIDPAKFRQFPFYKNKHLYLILLTMATLAISYILIYHFTTTYIPEYSYYVFIPIFLIAFITKKRVQTLLFNLHEKMMEPYRPDLTETEESSSLENEVSE